MPLKTGREREKKKTMSLETSSVVLRCFSFFKVEPQRKVFFFSGQTAKGSYCTFKDDSAHASTRQLACAYVRVCFSLCREFPKLAFFFLHSVYKDRYYRITICVLTSIKKKKEKKLAHVYVFGTVCVR